MLLFNSGHEKKFSHYHYSCLSRKGTSSFLLVSGGTGVEVEQNTARKKEDRNCDDDLDKDICDGDGNEVDGAIQPLEDYGHVIRDNFTSFEEVRNKIKEQGIKKCNVIIGINVMCFLHR